jgi:phosphatidylserine synthase
MVSTMRFRSVKAIEVGWRRSYVALFIAAVVIALVAASPRIALVALSYTYLASAFVGWAVGRVRRRGPDHAAALDTSDSPQT